MIVILQNFLSLSKTQMEPITFENKLNKIKINQITIIKINKYI